jgi:acetyl-CoA acyltransferase 1
MMAQLAPTEHKSSVSGNTTASSRSTGKLDTDVVIVSAVRTAIVRARRGPFKDTPIEDLLSAVLKDVVGRVKLNPKEVGDIVVGNVLGSGGQRANQARQAAFLAGFPESVAVHTVNRQCSSGLQALAEVAAAIKAGYYEVGIGAGMEHMSSADPTRWEGPMNPKVFMNQQAKDCLLPMGITSENVSARYGITRKQQDELGAMSHARAAAAQKAGKFTAEITTVRTKVKDPKTGAETDVVVDADDGIRADTTYEGLSKLKPAFDKNGSTTAGTSSQVSDGAAAVLAMSRKKANELGLPVIGVFRSYAVAGCAPDVMGIGPAVAIPQALKQAGLTTADIDLYEINEAFASQATYCVQKLGLSWDNVNVNGGALALGHPLGCTGARMVSTLLNEMGRRDSRYGVISMCIGSGMGAAAVFERDR